MRVLKIIPENNICKKTDKKPSINFFFPAILLLFLITRLVNLTILPIFNDEAIYISWAKIINEDLHNIWLPLTVDNSKPLFVWLIAIFLNFFEDPLWAARFVSVLAGFFSLIGIYFIGQNLHSKWIGCLSALFYSISPYFVFYDRMAHKDSLLNCLFIWLIYLTLELLKVNEKHRGRYCLAMGFIVGLSLLTKGTAILFAILPAILIFIFFRKNILALWKPLVQTYLPGFLIGGFPYGFLFLTSSGFSVKNIFIPAGNSMGQASITDILHKMPENLYRGIAETIHYFTTYLTIPVTLLALAFFIFQFKLIKDNKPYMVLIFYFLIPYFLLLGATGKGFSRHYLFCGTPILLWASMALYYGAVFLKQRLQHKFSYIANIFIILTLFSPAIAFNYTLLTKPSEAPFTDIDYNQYISSQFSGYGIPEALDYLKKISGENKITIFTDSNWGNPADAVYVYLSDDPNIDVYTAPWVFQSNLLPSGIQKIKTFKQYTKKETNPIDVSSLAEIYFICNSRVFQKSWFLSVNNNFRLIRSFGKPNSTDFIDIYKRI